MLIGLLERDGVDTSLLVRRDDVQTSSSVLPIRPDGSRPAFHVVGANATYGPDDVALGCGRRRVAPAPRRPGVHGRRGRRQDPRRARQAGVVTSADVLAPGDRGILEWIAPALPHLDYLLPNDEQAIGFTGAPDLESGMRCAHRARASAAWRRPAAPTACCSSTADDTESRAGVRVDVVDTTGCGDAFSAGFLRGLALGRDRRAAAELGCAAAALVAQGLGSDYGNFDLDTVDEFAEHAPRLGAVEQGR